MSPTAAILESSPDYRAAREALAHRVRRSAILDVEGDDRIPFLQGQLTQDVRALAPGEARAAAGLTPKGKLIYIARVVWLPDRLRLLLPTACRTRVLEHLEKYAVFQKVQIRDRSDEVLRIGLYGPGGASIALPSGTPLAILPGEGEFSREILPLACARSEIENWLASLASTAVSDGVAEILRVEAGRPRFGQDANESHLPDEVGLDSAISTTKGCYVGQEIVARLRTYGRVNKRLVGFRFPDGLLTTGSVLMKPEESQRGKIEWGRVTSAVTSPTFGPIGLGYAFREVPVGDRLVDAADPSHGAVVTALPFA